VKSLKAWMYEVNQGLASCEHCSVISGAQISSGVQMSRRSESVLLQEDRRSSRED